MSSFASLKRQQKSGKTTVAAPQANPGRVKRVNVWGLSVDKSMCGCRQQIKDDLSWSKTAADTYKKCDVPANRTGDDVEACFNAAHPSAVTVATTSSSGVVTLPAASQDPCQRISDKSTYIHETMHARHTEDIAKSQGSVFYKEWTRLAGDPDRLNKLRVRFPTEVAAHEKKFYEGHDWATDEVHSYTQERIFLGAVQTALGQVCK